MPFRDCTLNISQQLYGEICTQWGNLFPVSLYLLVFTLTYFLLYNYKWFCILLTMITFTVYAYHSENKCTCTIYWSKAYSQYAFKRFFKNIWYTCTFFSRNYFLENILNFSYCMYFCLYLSLLNRFKVLLSFLKSVLNKQIHQLLGSFIQFHSVDLLH